MSVGKSVNDLRVTGAISQCVADWKVQRGHDAIECIGLEQPGG